jgi:ubiquinone biosynthesis protein UbiJ
LEKKQRVQVKSMSPHMILRFASEIMLEKFPDANFEIFQPLLDAFPDDRKRLHIDKAVYKAYLERPFAILLNLVEQLLRRAKPECANEIHRMLGDVQASVGERMTDPKTGLLLVIGKGGVKQIRKVRSSI